MVGMVDMAMTWVDGDMFAGDMIERGRACSSCWLLVVGCVGKLVLFVLFAILVCVGVLCWWAGSRSWFPG